MEQAVAEVTKFRPSSALFQCRGEPDGSERWSRSSSACGSRASSLAPGDMGEVVRKAREVRRLIREASVDSSASDLYLDYSDWGSPCPAGSPEEPATWEELEELVGARAAGLGWEECRAAWRLTGPASTASSAWASEAGDPWEWDDEGIYQEEEVEGATTPALPDTLELDMEEELEGRRRRSRASSSSSTASDEVTLSAP